MDITLKRLIRLKFDLTKQLQRYNTKRTNLLDTFGSNNVLELNIIEEVIKSLKDQIKKLEKEIEDNPQIKEKLETIGQIKGVSNKALSICIDNKNFKKNITQEKRKDTQ